MIKHVILALSLLSPAIVEAAETSLYRNDGQGIAIHHAPGASDILRETAQELSRVLGTMSKKDFPVQETGDPAGIIIGTAEQFPQAPQIGKLDSKDPLRREEYLIQTDGTNVWLIGATDAGASHAAWDFLHRLGYRQYFPGELWEIIPPLTHNLVDFDLLESPAYKARVFAWHYGIWADMREDTQKWAIRNRIPPKNVFKDIFVLNTGHIYGSIINTFRTEFDAHPDMRSIVNGKPTSKLNPANPLTQKVTLEFADAFFENNPFATSISMDPSDGGGWGTSEAELAIGTPSDRAVFLANLVAKHISEKFGDKYVGIYSYNEHSTPPTRVRVEPNVVVSIATAFIQGGYSVEKLMEEWAAAGSVMMGIREYHSVALWDVARPRGGRAADLDYLSKTIPQFYQRGARFYTTESGDNWGPQGLGNYLTARATWNLEEAKKTKELIQEFVQACFPEAEAEMVDFYKNFLHSPKPAVLSDDLLGRMYRKLAEARAKIKNPTAIRRLEALILYTRYCELLLEYQNARALSSAADQQTAMEALVRFIYQTRETRMVSSLALYRELNNKRRNPALNVAEETDWKVPAEKNPLKETAPISEEEILAFLNEGVANNTLLEFEAKTFSRDLIPATPLLSTTDQTTVFPPKPFGGSVRGTNQVFVWSEGENFSLPFQATAGIVYKNRGAAKFTLFPLDLTTGDQGNLEGDDDEAAPVFTQPIASVAIEPDQTTQEMKLVAPRPGPFILQMEDQAGGVRIQDWPASHYFTVESSMDRQFNTTGRTNMVFYIPRGTKILGAFVRGKGHLENEKGENILTFSGKPEFISVPVAEGSDGQFWKYSGLVGGRIQLLTVPPYLAPSPSQLLLPREVVEADAAE